MSARMSLWRVCTLIFEGALSFAPSSIAAQAGPESGPLYGVAWVPTDQADDVTNALELLNTGGGSNPPSSWRSTGTYLSIDDSHTVGGYRLEQGDVVFIEVDGDQSVGGAVPVSLLWSGANSLPPSTIGPDSRPTPLLLHTQVENLVLPTAGLQSSPHAMAEAMGQLFSGGMNGAFAQSTQDYMVSFVDALYASPDVLRNLGGSLVDSLAAQVEGGHPQ